MENLALWYRRFGEPETVLQSETAPLGALAPGHLRVRMLFSPVNASDLIPITGAYRHRTPLPAVAGMKVSALSPTRPRPLRICWVNASCRCAVKAPAALC